MSDYMFEAVDVEFRTFYNHQRNKKETILGQLVYL